MTATVTTLIHQSFLVRHGTPSGEEAYLPTAAAFNFCGDTELRNRAKSATTVVFHALKQMFKGEQKKEGLVLDDLKRHVEYIYPNRIFDTSTLKLSLYLAKDFNVFGGHRLNPPDDTVVTWFQVGEGAISMADPETEWDRVMAQYKWHVESLAAGLLDRESTVKSGEERWERITPLGSGGQSDVFLVRRPERAVERRNCAERIRIALGGYNATELGEAAWLFARPEEEAELAALKVFKIPSEGETLTPLPGSEEYEAVERLKNEIAVLKQARPGLPRLLDSDLKERWIVTEYFSAGTLKKHPLKFKGNAASALKAFRSLVQTVASLHKDGYVHRDIKPPNVFIRKD